MEETTSREKILKKVRKALIHKSSKEQTPVDFESPVFVDYDQLPELTFAQQFVAAGGKFIFCEDQQEFIENFKAIVDGQRWGDVFCVEERFKEWFKANNIGFIDQAIDLPATEVSVCSCETLIARTGSIVVSARLPQGRKAASYAGTLVFIASPSQVVPHYKDALKFLKQKYDTQMPSLITLLHGPSQTKQLDLHPVPGPHGAKEMYLFLIDEAYPVAE